VIGAAAIAAFACGITGAGQVVAPEYQLKAAFIAKFAEFTEWPAAVFDSRPTIDICIARPSPFGEALSAFVAGETLRGRPFRVREIAGPAELAPCLMLFVVHEPTGDRRPLLTAAQKLPLLTIGDSPTFLDEGGIVRLRLIGGRVRFDIDVDAAGRVGIHFSSQLLRLALSVRGSPS
jgi:hypothetical protein